MKKVLLGSITLLLTLPVLVLSLQAAYAVSPPPEFALKCYGKTRDPPVDPGPVPFVDQFQAKIRDPDVDQRYCVEALKHSATPPPNPRYWVEHEGEPLPPDANFVTPTGVTLQDQFLGKFTANLFHFEFLMPAKVTGLTGTAPNTQHYSGYALTVLKSDNPLPQTVQVTDEFGTSMITINSNFAFETTAIIGGQGSLTGMDLQCYMVLDEDPKINPGALAASNWVTQFTPAGGVDVTAFSSATVFCVKAKNITPPSPSIGGELLPIDSTALLLAGLQTSTIWIIPTLAGLAGSGFYLIKFRTNKE